LYEDEVWTALLITSMAIVMVIQLVIARWRKIKRLLFELPILEALRLRFYKCKVAV
jgi:hypothetical protein